jgi:putative thioredoxin
VNQLTSASLRGAVDLSTLKHREQAPAADATGVIVNATDASFAQVLELSKQVPVIVDLWADWCQPCKQLSPILEKVVQEQHGRVVLVKVDVDANPQLTQAFNAQSIPLVVGLISGQPVPMFTGAVPEEQVRTVIGQLLELAAEHGVTGSVGTSDEQAEGEPELPPLHQAAFDAIEAGDLAAAVSAYERALAENPRDEDAKAGLGQVKLLQRVAGVDLQAARAAAAASPNDIAAQFLVADLDVSGGHIDDAFGRLLDLFATLADPERKEVRDRLVELFGLVGASDPRVISARSRLTSLMF